MLNFSLCFRSVLATEVVLYGTIRLDSEIRSQNVYLHDSFWREQTLAATKLFLSLTRINYAIGLSSRAARISSRAVRVFAALSLRRDLFSYGFPRKLRAGPYGSYDKLEYAGSFLPRVSYFLDFDRSLWL